MSARRGSPSRAIVHRSHRGRNQEPLRTMPVDSMRRAIPSPVSRDEAKRVNDARALEFLRQGGDSFMTTTVDAVVNWGRKYSMFLYPVVTASCGTALKSLPGPAYDIDRF